MRLKCSVRGCLSKSLKGSPWKFFQFPQDNDYREKWTKFCSSGPLNYSTARICSRHFEKKFIIKRPMDVALGLECPVRFRNIADDALPTLNPPPGDGEEFALKTEEKKSVVLTTTQEQSNEASTSETASASSTTPRYIFCDTALGKSISNSEGHPVRKLTAVPIILRKPQIVSPKVVQIAGNHAKLCEKFSMETDNDSGKTNANSIATHTLSKEEGNGRSIEDEDSTSSTGKGEVNLIGIDANISDSNLVSPSGEVPTPPMELLLAGVGSNLSQEDEGESACQPPPAKKLRKLLPKSPENLGEEVPYMTFVSDDHATTSMNSLPCNNTSVKSSGKGRPSNSSQYIVIKRSLWKENDQKLRLLTSRVYELNNLSAKYTKALEEIQSLNQRLALATGGNVESVNETIKVLKLENASLNLEIAGLCKDKERLANENRHLRTAKENLEERFKKHAIMLKQYFTSGQLKRMFADDPMKRSHWSPEDITQALTLKSESVAAYNYLQDRYSFLLPNLATLRRWVRTKKINIEEQAATDPAKPPSEQDKALQNLILLHDQTNENGSEEIILDESLLGNEGIEIVIEE